MKAIRSIKSIISLVVFLLGLILIGLDWSKNERLLMDRTLARMEREAQSTGARMAGLMQHCFRNNQPRAAELEMSYAALLPDLALGVVADETGVVRFSTRLLWRNRSLRDTPIASMASSELLSRASSDGVIQRDDTHGRVVALYPFFATYDSDDLGMVALSYDASQAMERSKRDAFWESLSRACYLSAACLLLWLALDFFVTRRVDRLLEFASGMQEGLPVPNPETGTDELGLIAHTFADSVEKLRETEARLLEASEEERRRIGRDIHDDVCQRIAAAQLKCGVLSSVLSRDGLPHADLAVDVAKELQEAVMITRGFAHGLNPVRVGTEGLEVALSEMGGTLERSFGPDFEVKTDIGDVQLSPAVQTHIFRILQELMTNAAKHAHPTWVRTRVILDGPRLRMEVENDGLEFDSENAGTGGLGLRFVQQRVRALGGRLQFLPRGDSREGVLAICEVLLGEHQFSTN
ncbi:MAG: hypothetical protein KA152_13890 [Verrucomicrobiales bacterium]|nr:hypothetical protein [Verrucomicrobiales bacterium]